MKGEGASCVVSVCYSLLLLLSTPPSEAGPDPNVCIPGPPSGEGPLLPTLPNQYSLRVEGNFQDKHKTMELQEYYDKPGNRGAADSLVRGHTEHTTYDYNTGQAIRTYGDHCVVSNMSTAPFNLYGFRLVDGHPNIGGVGDVFRFGKKFNETYIGQEYVRGILTNHWQNCMYEEDSNTTFVLDYYFTLPGAQTAGGGDEIPVRAVINGTAGTGDATEPLRSFYHYYEFHEFLPGPVHIYRAFEPPLGSYCENRTSDEPFPIEFGKVNYFKLGAEVAFIEQKRIYTLDEYYNNPQNIVSFQYEEWEDGNPGDFFKEVHDYNLDLSFKINQTSGLCSVGPIPIEGSKAGSKDGMQVYLKSITSFLSLPGIYWVYEGKSKKRGIGAESWIARVLDTPGTPGYTVDMTLQFFFTNETWQSPAKYHKAANRVPLGLDVEFTVKKNGAIKHTFHMEENFYGMYYGPFDPEMVDVSICYVSRYLKELAVDMEEKHIYDQYVQNNTNHFYFGVIDSLSIAANVSASRISSPMAIEGTGGLMTVYFKLLGIPPVRGDPANMPHQISLEEAYENLEAAVSSGLDINFAIGEGNKVNLSVATDSLRTDFYNPNVSTGYSVAAFAGMGVGMLVAGVLLTVVAAYLIPKACKKPGEEQFDYMNIQN